MNMETLNANGAALSPAIVYKFFESLSEKPVKLVMHVEQQNALESFGFTISESASADNGGTAVICNMNVPPDRIIGEDKGGNIVGMIVGLAHSAGTKTYPVTLFGFKVVIDSNSAPDEIRIHPDVMKVIENQAIIAPEPVTDGKA